MSERNPIKRSTKRLAIYCLGNKGYVGLNRIGLKMVSGLNVVCLCNIYELHQDLFVFLTPGPGMSLIECFNYMEDTQTFLISTHIHLGHCPAKSFPTLKELSYFGMIRAGYFDSVLEEMESKGKIPKCVLKEAPKITYHEVNMYLTDFVPIWHPYIFHYTKACSNPDNHMIKFLLRPPL
jgi:hypothetical protein